MASGTAHLAGVAAALDDAYETVGLRTGRVPTSHTAGATDVAVAEMARQPAANLDAFLAGAPLRPSPSPFRERKVTSPPASRPPPA